MKLRAGPAREGRIPLMGGWEGFKVVHRRPRLGHSSLDV